jgi:hypothetical protein
MLTTPSIRRSAPKAWLSEKLVLASCSIFCPISQHVGAQALEVAQRAAHGDGRKHGAVGHVEAGWRTPSRAAASARPAATGCSGAERDDHLAHDGARQRQAVPHGGAPEVALGPRLV